MFVATVIDQLGTTAKSLADLCRASIWGRTVVFALLSAIVLFSILKHRDSAWVRLNAHLESVTLGSTPEHAKSVLGVEYDDYTPAVVGKHYGDAILHSIDEGGTADIVLVYRVPVGTRIRSTRLFLAYTHNRLVGKTIR